jgi:hypothetical protein
LTQNSAAVQFTQYFLATRQRPDRQLIDLAWVQSVIERPLHRELQADGRIRLWAAIAQSEGRYLRVVLLDDGVTVHNAFFDRGFKP